MVFNNACRKTGVVFNYVMHVSIGKQLDDLPTLCILTTVSKGLLEGWEKLWIEIGNSFSGASNIPVHSLPTKGRNEGEVLHCMGVWLAYRAETTAPVTWKQLGGILKNADLLQVFSQLKALSGRNLDDATGKYAVTAKCAIAL